MERIMTPEIDPNKPVPTWSQSERLDALLHGVGKYRYRRDPNGAIAEADEMLSRLGITVPAGFTIEPTVEERMRDLMPKIMEEIREPQPEPLQVDLSRLRLPPITRIPDALLFTRKLDVRLREIMQWHLETFPQATLAAQSEKVLEEANELFDAIESWQNCSTTGSREGVYEEVADIFISLLGLCRILEMDPIALIQERLETVKARVFQLDADGIYHTVKDRP